MQNLLDDWTFVSVDLEITNQCQNCCALCPREAITRPVGAMEAERFRRIAEILGKCASLVSLSGMGDPWLHPQVFSFCSELRGRGTDVSIALNPASLGGAEPLAELVASQPNSIVVSFPSSRKEVFERICPKISYERALESTRSLIRLAKGKAGLAVSGIRTRINPDEEPEFVRFWRSEGVRAEMRVCHGRGGNLARTELYIPGERGLAPERCGLFSFHSFVAWQGDVLACCHDLTGETRLGNLLEEGREEIARRKAEILRAGMPFDLCTRCDEPLRTCSVPAGPPPTDRRARRRFFRKLKNGSG